MSWLRTFFPRPDATLRLLCFPHAGGSAGVFRPLAGLLPPDIELIAVQYPGRQDRFEEPCAPDVATMARGVLAEIGSIRRPMALFGHSMGATVAFEVARLLSAPPVRLFASARSAPSRCRPVRVDVTSEDDLISHVQALGSVGSRSLDIEPRLRPLVLPVLRADLAVVNSYRYTVGPLLRCPITVIAGSTDITCAADDLAAWRRHTLGGFDQHVLPGGHFYLEQSLPELAELLATTLPAARITS